MAWSDGPRPAYACVLVLIAAGCGGDGMVTSTGTVTCDGRPIVEGAISFHPLEPGLAPQGTRILAGRYRIRTRAGRQRVEIVASRPKADAAELTPGMKPLEQFLPPRYNAESILEATVGGGRNVFDFDLESAP